ncbi:lactonase family protein [Agrobacterium sp. NPDC089420]|uniref:lactonase family protein n=1 Tax=Agrobacterium sp. NPDC089420 TaxID=3363918 RepID=UPI00384F157C
MTRGRDLYAYVGARTTQKRNARGNGLNVYRLTRQLQWVHLQLLELENPSFLAFDRTGQCLYTVHGDSDRVSAFAIDEAKGTLTFLNEQSTRGHNPVHLAFDPSNRYMVVANHITSSLALLPRFDDGSLGPVCDLAQVTGAIGPHRIEQAVPKPHQVEFDPSGKWIAVPDKGTDKVLVFAIDAAGSALREISHCAARETSGPRHIAFHPRGHLAYVINELDSTVTGYRFDRHAGKLQPLQILSSLPDGFTANSRASEIGITADGRFVYASNRGSDTIAGFAVGDDGRLELIGHWPTAGRTPRFFSILPGDRMLVANEDSDTVVAFDIDRDSGALVRRDEVLHVGSPVCILTKAAN